MGSLFDGCDDRCGWIAAIISALAYGSFAVPIKETIHVQVHPLVLQSYKTIVVFLTCWCVLFLGVSVSWTPWGLVSGIFWVVGGCGGIFAIRMAGMAIAVGTWASMMICVNFVWGIIAFHEPVANIGSTLCAFLLLGLGLIGMSKYSAPPPNDQVKGTQSRLEQTNLLEKESLTDQIGGHDAYRSTSSSSYGTDDTTQQTGHHMTTSFDVAMTDSAHKTTDNDSFVFLGFVMTRRIAGILGAVFDGLMIGTSLVPLHYAEKQGFGGANYIISFAYGAIFANVAVWGVFFVHVYRQQYMSSGSRLRQACDSMPAWHVRQLWLPGLIAGLLQSIAVFGSILAVTYLGQGVGNSVIQSKILISGLWGIFWYKEIRRCDTIAKWFAAASLTVLGIIWLSHERLAATRDNHRDLMTSFD